MSTTRTNKEKAALLHQGGRSTDTTMNAFTFDSMPLNSVPPNRSVRQRVFRALACVAQCTQFVDDCGPHMECSPINQAPQGFCAYPN